MVSPKKSHKLAVIRNSVIIPSRFAAAIHALEGKVWQDDDEVLDEDGYLQFSSDDPDDDDVVDALENNDVVVLLQAARVKGEIVFCEVNSPSGYYWGYRFDGNGGMVRLEGKFQLAVARPNSKKSGKSGAAKAKSAKTAKPKSKAAKRKKAKKPVIDNDPGY